MLGTAAFGFFIFIFFKGNFALGCGVGQYQNDAACTECKSTCSKCISEFVCTECKDGFFGEACTRNCSESCSDKSCVKETGDCLSCNKGYFLNETCEHCPEKCIECKDKDECTNCKTGYTGSICQKVCVNCKPNSSCSIIEGICSDGCKDGYSGRTCLEHCHSNCISCGRVDANKCTSCVEGRYGQNCEKACPTKCIDDSCSKDIGTCKHGCQNGFWGDQCEYPCPVNCRGGSCLRGSGHCSDGCNGSFTGTKCFCPRSCDCDVEGTCIKCDDKSGYVCDKQCKEICLSNICSLNPERKCLYGCKEEYKDRLCIEETTKPEQNQTPAWKIIVPIFAIAAVIILSCVVLSVLIKKRCLGCRRRQSSGQVLENGTSFTAGLGVADRFLSPENNTDFESLPVNQEDNPYDVLKNVGACSCENKLTVLKDGRPDEEKTKPLALPPYHKPSDQGALSTKKAIIRLKDLTSDEIVNEFKRLSASTDIKEEEKTSAYDLLKTKSVSKIVRDAFNACYIDGYRKTEAYIACKFPEFKQKELFWNMVWDEGCDRIVMLTDSNISEESSQYWPKRGEVFKHGYLTVKLLGGEEEKEDIDDDFIEKKLAIKKKTEERIVLQLHFTGWPENLVPRSATSLIEFQKYRDQITSEKVVPVVVQCSDGIGRTGTYIAFDRLIQEGKATGYVDVFTCVKNLQEQRSITLELQTQGKPIVQSQEQYYFLYQVLQSWFKQEQESKKRQVLLRQTVDSAHIQTGESRDPNTVFSMFSLLDSLDTT